MTSPRELLATLDVMDGVYYTRRGHGLQEEPLHVVGITIVDGRLLVSLVGPRGGEYTLVSKPGEPVRVRLSYSDSNKGFTTAPVKQLAVVPAHMMPTRSEAWAERYLSGEVSV